MVGVLVFFWVGAAGRERFRHIYRRVDGKYPLVLSPAENSQASMSMSREVSADILDVVLLLSRRNGTVFWRDYLRENMTLLSGRWPSHRSVRRR